MTSFSVIHAQEVFKVEKLYYTIANEVAKAVKLVPESYPAAKYPSGYPAGNIVIPKTIVHPVNGQTYTVTEISKNAFAGGPGQHDHPLTGIVVPNTVQRIDSFAFRECRNLKTLEFEAGSPITRIYRSMCEYCNNLEKIVLPPNVTVIEDWVFLECSNLEEITLPKEIKVIYEFAFRDCQGLYDIYSPAQFPPTFATPETDREAIPGWVFYGTPISDIELTVPVGAKKNYTGYPWDSFLKINEKNFASGVRNAYIALDITIGREGNNVVLSGLETGKTLQIVDITGKTVVNRNIKQTTEKVQLGHGIFIIHVDQKSKKISL